MSTARKIVAIGGGELKDLETLEIDKRIVELTGKTRPKALFIPTASGDAVGYMPIPSRHVTVNTWDVKRAPST